MKRFALLLSGLACILHTTAQRISADLVMQHISFLASDEIGGRATATPEELEAARYIAIQFKGMGLRPKGNDGYYYDFSYQYNPNVHDTTNKGIPHKIGHDVVAYLDNHAALTVVIGAHYDHLGRGYDHNSLDPNPEGKIHNGADDNASGVAGMLELARYFSLNGITEHYNFLFMAFSGEELGLIGSKKWCEKPTVPLKDINYMINLDMIGRLNDSTRKLLIYGVGTSPAWMKLMEKWNRNFSVKYDSSGIGPSDQTSFYLKDIPVLHYFTGQHSDYHKPTDDAYKINAKGEAEILETIINTVQDLDQQPRLGFLKTKSNESTKMSFKVTMGIMPDYVFEGKGLRLDGVSDEKPAAKAGLQAGDVLVQMDGKDIQSIQDYMKILNTLNKGDEIEVIILHNGDRLSKKVHF